MKMEKCILTELTNLFSKWGKLLVAFFNYIQKYVRKETFEKMRQK